MKKEEIKELVAELFREQMATRPSVFRQLWEWLTPHIVPVIIGVIFGMLLTGMLFDSRSPLATLTTNHSPLTTKTTLEHQAAIGGAAIPPFSILAQPNASPLPSLWNSPPGDWIEEIADTPFTNTSSEEASPSSPQVGSGQANSLELYPTRLLRRR